MPCIRTDSSMPIRCLARVQPPVTLHCHSYPSRDCPLLLNSLLFTFMIYIYLLIYLFKYGLCLQYGLVFLTGWFLVPSFSPANNIILFFIVEQKSTLCACVCARACAYITFSWLIHLLMGTRLVLYLLLWIALQQTWMCNHLCDMPT